MLIEGIENLDRSEARICVIGSGPVGLSIAVECARRGVPTLLLEAGGKGALSEVQHLSDAERIEPARHDDMSIAVARRLGGTSHLWGGRCVPFDPVDFAAREGIGARWPISYADMAAYLPRAVEATASGAAVYRADQPLFPSADDLFDADALERWVNIQSSSERFKADIEGNLLLEVRTLATVTGMVFSESGAVERLEAAHSLSGERVAVPVKDVVLAGGGVETARLLLAAGMASPGRFGGDGGALGRYYMGHVYGEIADIVFDDPRLSGAMDYYVDAHGSYVRRRFVASEHSQREHGLLNAAFWPLVPPVADARHKSAILSSVYLALRNRRIGNLLVAEAIRHRHIPADGGSILPHIANVATGLPGALAFGADFFRKRYFSANRLPGFFIPNKAHRYSLSYHGEHAPNEQSRIWLNGQVDRLGVPKVAIDLRFAARDAQSIVATQDLLESWLERNRIGRLRYRMPREERTDNILATATHGTHQIGLARMASTRRHGVANAELQTFDCPNLHLAGCAVLPTSGQANPTLTAVALGLRLADRLIGQADKDVKTSWIVNREKNAGTTTLS